MKAKSILLAELVAVAGLIFVPLPAGAECWMVCPPGSTAAPSSKGDQGATATVEPAASPQEATPAKKPKATAKASPTAPVKPRPAAAPAEAEPATEPPSVQSTTPAQPARTQGPVAPPAPVLNAAFQPAPTQPAAPAPVPIPGTVPGTATMHVVPE